MELSLVKLDDNRFAPAYDSDYEKALKIKVGDIYKCELSKPRNYKKHRLYFAILQMVFDSQETFTSPLKLRDFLTIEAGFYDWEKNKAGDYTLKPRSISFETMDGFEFNELYDRTLDVIWLHFNLSQKTIEANIHLFL